MEKISIIVPAYNVEKEVGRCIDSLINQTYRNIEIIIINDGSTDNTLAICQSYSDDRIKIVNKANGGLSDARNVGLENATGVYILFVDSDDYIEHDTCEIFLNTKQNDMPDILVGDFYITYENDTSRNLVEVSHPHLKNGMIYDSNSYLQISVKNRELRMEAWHCMYKRTFLIEGNYRFKKGIYHEDMQLTPLLLLNAKRIMYVKKTFYYYVQRQGSIMHQSNISKRTKDCMDIYQEWISLSDKIENHETKKCFEGFIARCYLKTCSSFSLKDYRIMSKKKLIMSSIGMSEKAKAIIFSFNPKLYYRIIRGIK